MAAITPDTQIRLLKVDLSMDESNELTFSSKSAQTDYFLGLTHDTEQDKCTYMRKDGVIRYPKHIDSILKYNYVMYKNNNYSNKWFYAFITNMEYANDGMTNISIKTDVFQTWQFDITYKRCFVEREHVNNDTAGLHTVPENIITGDVISCKLQPTTSANPEKCFVIAVSELLDGVNYSTLNQKVPSGLYFIGLTSDSGVRTYIKAYDKAGKAEAINSVFVSLKSFFTSWRNTTINVDGTNFTIEGETSTNVTFEYNETITVTKVNYLANDYIPKNKKLLTFPYSFLQVSNHNGNIVNYKWEDFNLLLNGNDITFSLKGTITPGGSFSAYPIDYKNILNNYDENINLGKYPIGGWNSDVYTNWLTQNGINIGGVAIDATTYRIGKSITQAAVGTAQVALGDATGSMNIAGGLIDTFNALQDDYRHSLIPDQANGNVNIGDFSFQFGLTNLEFKRMSVKEEYAKIIDSFFSSYGYKVSTMKIPNITGRRNWNYVKTIDCNLEGNIPQSDLIELKNLFNKGITLWHNPSTFLDYSQSNPII